MSKESLSLQAAIREPEVKSHLDLRSYLGAYYAHRKQLDPSFSYAVWAAELSIKSRSYLRLLSLGKRALSQRMIPVFIAQLRLRGSDAAYFRSLVGFSQAPTLVEREHYWAEIARFRTRSIDKTPVLDRHLFSSCPITSRLFTLLTYEEVAWTVEKAARVLGVREELIRNRFSILESLGLVSMAQTADGSTRWSAISRFFEVPDELGAFALQSFHRRSLEEAIRAIDLPTDSRNYRSICLALSAEAYRAAVEKTRAFLDSLLGELAGSAVPGARLYQINLNLIPVSEPILPVDTGRSEPVGHAQKESPNSISQELSV